MDDFKELLEICGLSFSKKIDELVREGEKVDPFFYHLSVKKNAEDVLRFLRDVQGCLDRMRLHKMWDDPSVIEFDSLIDREIGRLDKTLSNRSCIYLRTGVGSSILCQDLIEFLRFMDKFILENSEKSRDLKEKDAYSMFVDDTESGLF